MELPHSVIDQQFHAATCRGPVWDLDPQGYSAVPSVAELRREGVPVVSEPCDGARCGASCTPEVLVLLYLRWRVGAQIALCEPSLLEVDTGGVCLVGGVEDCHEEP